MAGLGSRNMFNLIFKKLPSYFQKWLHYFKFPVPDASSIPGMDMFFKKISAILTGVCCGISLKWVFFFPLSFSNIYLTAPGLSCSKMDLPSSLQHAGSLGVAFEFLVVVYEI